MPQYKRKLLENYPREFWRSLLNPEGHVYRCFFCDEFFETKSQSIQHMKVCALEETGEEYDEEYDEEYGEEVMVDESELNEDSVVMEDEEGADES